MRLDWLKHAFAVAPGEPFEPTEPQRELIDRLCRQVVARELTTPALVFLESVSPLNFVTSQTLRFFGPCLTALGGKQAFDELTAILEHRGAIPYLCRRLEELARERP